MFTHKQSQHERSNNKSVDFTFSRLILLLTKASYHFKCSLLKCITIKMHSHYQWYTTLSISEIKILLLSVILSSFKILTNQAAHDHMLSCTCSHNWLSLILQKLERRSVIIMLMKKMQTDHFFMFITAYSSSISESDLRSDNDDAMNLSNWRKVLNL